MGYIRGFVSQIPCAVKQSALCALSTIIIWRYGSSLEGTEFSGARLTGSLLDMKDIGALLFVVALLGTFFYRRTASAIAVLASTLCFPLFLYFTAPGPFRWLFRGEYSVPQRANFEWDTWTSAGLMILAATTFFSLRTVLTREGSTPRNSK